jgi:hypothetical protein
MLTLLLLQSLVLLLLVWLAAAPLAAAWARSVQSLAATLLLLASALAGIWPAWWLPWLYAAALALALWRAWRRPRAAKAGSAAKAAALLLGAIALFAASLSAQALAGRRPPPGAAVALAFPLEGRGYVVVNGGSNAAVSSHVETLAPRTERMRAYRGQSHGVDFAAIGPWGFTARGIEPADPRLWAIYGRPVLAPCDGTVLRAQDGVPDNRVPRMNRRHMAGNFVLLRCASADVLLAHFAPGTLAVRPGEAVRTGRRLGRVGNSGNSSAPHLHVHAQRPGPPGAPFAGAPLPILFEGRYLVRGDRW